MGKSRRKSPQGLDISKGSVFLFRGSSSPQRNPPDFSRTISQVFKALRVFYEGLGQSLHTSTTHPKIPNSCKEMWGHLPFLELWNPGIVQIGKASKIIKSNHFSSPAKATQSPPMSPSSSQVFRTLQGFCLHHCWTILSIKKSSLLSNY